MVKFDFSTVNSFSDAKTMCCKILDEMQNKTVYIAVVSSCNCCGQIRATTVFVYNNYFNLSEIINEYEYSAGTAVDVYIADSDRFIGIKQKLFDGLCYGCLANYQPRYISKERDIIARKLFDLKAIVFMYNNI